MYSLDLFLFLFALVLIIIINLTSNAISNKIRGMYRIGPHNIDILSIIYGFFLEDAQAEKRLSGIGTIIFFF